MPTVSFKGNPIELMGEEVRAGQKAPDFRIQLADMSDCSLATHRGKTRVYCSLPSLDTPVCSTEMKRFNDEAAKMNDVVVVAISMDLPFAQKRWCAANGAENVISGSDHREGSFGKAFGCLVKSGPLERLLSRAVFVVGPDDKIRHVQYVPEIGAEPDYAAALEAARV